MAKFVRIWTARDRVLSQLVAAAEDAEVHRMTEYNAAVKIQSWFRGIRLRAYIKYLTECVVIIQKNYRGYLGRLAFLERLEEAIHEKYERYYNKMAARIQSAWRGYYVRKYVFDYSAYKEYLANVIKTNETVLAKLKEEREKAEEEKLVKEEKVQKMLKEFQARRHHYMLSTESQDGVFRTQRYEPFEKTMRSIRYLQPDDDKTKKKPPKLKTFKDTFILPPLVPRPKTQGPFRTQEEVWKQRNKPLSPSLRVSTDYDSKEIARAKLKAEEWRNRVIDEKFVPFSIKRDSYQPSIHTQSSYVKPAHGTKTFRTEKPINKQDFRRVVPPIPLFEKLNRTY